MRLPLPLFQLSRPGRATAELIKERKAAVEKDFTVAQQRAHAVYARGQAEVTGLAQDEYDAVMNTIRNSAVRLRELIDTDAIPAGTAYDARVVHGDLTKTLAENSKS